MEMLDDNGLFELYLDAAKRCTSALLGFDDETILYNLYEEFDISVVSFFHDKALERLFEANFIDKEIVDLSRVIRNKWMNMQSLPRGIREIKSRIEWAEFFKLTDQLSENLRFFYPEYKFEVHGTDAAAQEQVKADSHEKSTGNEENHEVQEGKEGE